MEEENKWTELFTTRVLPDVIANPRKIRLRRCICGIRFDCVEVGFRVSDTIKGNRTHEINPKNNKTYVLCERCRLKQKEYKDKNKEHAKVVKQKNEARPEVKARRRELINQPHNKVA